MNDHAEITVARRLFDAQIECIMNDDRETQFELYAESLRYEFPFANDRPRLIVGRDAFRAVMTPLWEEARRQGARVLACRAQFHATDEAGLFLAVFTLDVSASGKTVSLPFIQLLRIQNRLIVEVREYFNPVARATIGGEEAGNDAS
jgi:ketosteroid isomerase-like protein